jgi:hypothetical protein
VLEGARKTINKYKPTIFLATHGAEKDHICREIFEELEYDVVSIKGFDDELLARPRTSRSEN